ncbi:MAG: AI-2E family transporter [Cyanobacteria bacterium RI_101]|nr:AI-2E family transporter [Cyanobacteria bacterium RI_101]
MTLSQWLGLTALAISVYILWQLRQLLLLVFLAIVLTTALLRGVKALERFGLRRPWAVSAVLLLTFGLMAAFFALVLPPFWEQFKVLIGEAPRAENRLRELWLNLESEGLKQALESYFQGASVAESLAQAGANLAPRLLAWLSNSLNASLQIVFALGLAVMMVCRPQSYRRLALKLFPAFYRRRADEILTLSESALGNWLTGIFINSLFIAALSGLGLWALGIKLVLVHAIMAGLLNFIPNIGPAASVVFPLMIALLDSPWKIGAVLVLYFVIQNIESYWLTPIVMAKQVALLPAATLMAQLVFASVLGLWGLILALPLAVVVKTWLEEALIRDILDQWV